MTLITGSCLWIVCVCVIITTLLQLVVSFGTPSPTTSHCDGSLLCVPTFTIWQSKVVVRYQFYITICRPLTAFNIWVAAFSTAREIWRPLCHVMFTKASLGSTTHMRVCSILYTTKLYANNRHLAPTCLCDNWYSTFNGWVDSWYMTCCIIQLLCQTYTIQVITLYFPRCIKHHIHSLYFSKRGAYWDRLCRDVVDSWSLVGWLVGCHARALWPNGAS